MLAAFEQRPEPAPGPDPARNSGDRARPTKSHGQDERTQLRKHAPNVRTFMAMLISGAVLGVLFPWVVSWTVTYQPGREIWFRVLCVAAGLAAGALSYGVAQITLYRTLRALNTLATHDPLTSLANHRQFIHVLRVETSRSLRFHRPLSLIIADLDHFKTVNDTYGHLVGDQVLSAVARIVTKTIRPYDAACRIGGDELALILPDTDKQHACEIADRLRAAVASDLGGHLPAVTMSMGVATFPEDAEMSNLLMTRADDAMYAAKRAGRNMTMPCGLCDPRGLGATSPSP
jgi:diguanylate cyclase (GGDEF)-like protein